MPDIAQNVRRLSAAAWRLRAAAPKRDDLPPFALVLFTDDRRQDNVLGALAEIPNRRQLPPLAVLFRHDRIEPLERMSLADKARHAVQRKGHYFLMARGSLPGADGHHGFAGAGWVSWPIHDLSESVSAAKAGADIGFVSPVFPTASHPGAPGLGPGRASAIAWHAGMPCFGLGGITPGNSQRLRGLPIYGIGAIGAWSG